MGQEQGKPISESLVRNNYNQESETGINNLISVLLNHVYECHAMICYFRRADVGLSGIALYYKIIASELYGLVQKTMEYQLNRGCWVSLVEIKAPKFEQGTINSPLDTFELVLNKFKHLNDELIKVNEIAVRLNDPHLQKFIQHELLNFTAYFTNEISEKIAKLTRIGTGFGEYAFDADLKIWVNENYIDDKEDGYHILRKISNEEKEANSFILESIRDSAQNGLKDILEAIKHIVIKED